MRYIVEGIWSGYYSYQERCCHREVVSKKLYKQLEKLNTIVYTDNTTLMIIKRTAMPREKIKEIKGYTELIRKSVRYFPDKERVYVADFPKQESPQICG